jgi:RNA polymerase sigma-70 factor (ECF subfamily)
MAKRPAQPRIGDEEVLFSELADRYRRELRAHCFRMLGSLEEAEDMVQETFLRAWRWRASVRHGASYRAWLYKIATNACLDALRARSRAVRAVAGHGVLQGQLASEHPLEAVAPRDAEPDAEVVAKETIELAFQAAIEHLPPRQRAVLILRDVLGSSASDTADRLEASVTAVNSALQRARAALRERLPEPRLAWTAGSDQGGEERALVERYVEAIERGDADAIAGMVRERPGFGIRHSDREAGPQLVGAGGKRTDQGVEDER